MSGTQSTPPAPRFVVTELEGYVMGAEGRNRSNRPGLAVQVLDRAYCHRLVKEWRSEDFHTANGLTPEQQIRLRAKDAADALNRGEPLRDRPLRRVMRRGALKPPAVQWTCPTCGDWKSPAAITCNRCRPRKR